MYVWSQVSSFGVKRFSFEDVCVSSNLQQMYFLCFPFLRYYRFNEDSRRVEDGYPKSIDMWQGVPENIKAAFMSKDQGKVNM